VKIPDDGQRSCRKHVDFNSKNKFEKLVHLVGFTIRIYHDASSPEHQIWMRFFCFVKFYVFFDRAPLYNRVKKNQLDAKLILRTSIFLQPNHNKQQRNYAGEIRDIHITVNFMWAASIPWIPTKMNHHSSYNYKTI